MSTAGMEEAPEGLSFIILNKFLSWPCIKTLILLKKSMHTIITIFHKN